MKYAYVTLIKKGRLSEYTKYDKRGWKDSTKRRQYLKKVVEVMAEGKGKDVRNGEDEWYKGKLQ